MAGDTFFVIAILARRNDIPLFAFPSPAQRDDMIHCQIFPAHFAMAIITLAILSLPHPPGRTPQVAGLFFFPPDFFFRHHRALKGHGIETHVLSTPSGDQ